MQTETELVYISRKRTTSFNENDTQINKNCEYNASNRRENSNTKDMTFQPTLYSPYGQLQQYTERRKLCVALFTSKRFSCVYRRKLSTNEHRRLHAAYTVKHPSFSGNARIACWRTIYKLLPKKNRQVDNSTAVNFLLLSTASSRPHAYFPIAISCNRTVYNSDRLVSNLTQ